MFCGIGGEFWEEIWVGVKASEIFGEAEDIEEDFEFGDEMVYIFEASELGELEVEIVGVGIARIKVDDPGEHEADGLSVDHSEGGGEGIGGGVGGPEHGVFDCGASEGRPDLHGATGGEIVGIEEDGFERGEAEAESFARIESGDGVAGFGDGGFYGVSDGIDASAGGDLEWLGESEEGVEDGDFGGGFGIATSHFLVSGFVGDEGKALAFAARAGGGGNGDEWEHGVFRLPDAPVVFDFAAIGEDKIGGFGGIDATAAAEADDGIDLGMAGDFHAEGDIESRGIFANGIEDHDLEAGGFEGFGGSGGVTGGGDAVIGDEEDAFALEFTGEMSDLVERIGTEDEASAWVGIK